jgi:hypothetical protein
LAFRQGRSKSGAGTEISGGEAYPVDLDFCQQTWKHFCKTALHHEKIRRLATAQTCSLSLRKHGYLAVLPPDTYCRAITRVLYAKDGSPMPT